MSFSKFCVIFVLLVFTVFTGAVMWAQWHSGIPDALIYGVFAFLSAEGGLLAWLKVAERKAKPKPKPAKKAKIPAEKTAAELLRAAADKLEGG